MDENEKLVLRMARELGKDGRFGPVVPCFMQINRPSVPEGLRALVGMGIDIVYIQPCFLAGGVHISKDIPEAVGIEIGSDEGSVRIDGRSIELRYCRPVGGDDRLVHILSDRIQERMDR